MTRYAVIMAGGSGERFWPWSRSNLPKQFLTLHGQSSLIQQSVERVQNFFDSQNILVVVRREHASLAREQLPHLPQENFIIEPVGRNTAPCIGLAAIYLRKRDPHATMLAFPADHLVQDQASFLHCLENAFQLASSTEFLVTIGISPTRPETGYGYIEREGKALPGVPSAFKVRRFVEKPDLDKALKFFSSDSYFWNSGIFVWKTELILKKLAKYLPELYHGLAEIALHLGSEQEQEMLKNIFPSLPSISIDYGVMEKDADILVVQGDFLWDDLGSWDALAEFLPKDQNQMGVCGEFIGIDTTNCLIYGQQNSLIATLGVQDLVIVQAGNAVLICSKERTQEIKKLVEVLKEKGLTNYL